MPTENELFVFIKWYREWTNSAICNLIQNSFLWHPIKVDVLCGLQRIHHEIITLFSSCSVDALTRNWFLSFNNMPSFYCQQDAPVKAELTELKPVSDPNLAMHTTMGIPNLAPPPQVQQQSFDMMRSSAVAHSPTFIAVPSSNLIQASHPMANGQGYTMRLSDHTQSHPASQNTSSVGYSTVGQSVMTTSPSYASRKYLSICLPAYLPTHSSWCTVYLKVVLSNIDLYCIFSLLYWLGSQTNCRSMLLPILNYNLQIIWNILDLVIKFFFSYFMVVSMCLGSQIQYQRVITSGKYCLYYLSASGKFKAAIANCKWKLSWLTISHCLTS